MRHSEDAIIRLFGAILLEQNDEWAAQRRYMPPLKVGGILTMSVDNNPATQRPTESYTTARGMIAGVSLPNG